ncbi:MAG: stage III sporulation protein AA [Amphibacillus sp.]|nr:stage III sporulation protein AA [Amphibacillus sp.]
MEQSIARLFPEKYRQRILLAIQEHRDNMEEIRVRLNRPLELVLKSGYATLDELIPDESDGQYILNQLSGYSRYKFEEELKQGYITVAGGYRVGIVGRTVLEKGSIKQIQSISSFNIRMASEKIGIAQPIINSLVKQSSYYNTLIVGPPQSGKTTLIRDISRLIGTGWGHMEAKKVGIVDERSEIAGSRNGIPFYQVGKRTDILDNCPKSEGMMLMIRSMSPDIIIVDEIGSVRDIEAIQEVIRSGVGLVCTLHSDSYQSIKQSKHLKPIIDNQFFQRYLVLSRNKKITILDHEGKTLGLNRRLTNELDWGNSFNHRNLTNWI